MQCIDRYNDLLIEIDLCKMNIEDAAQDIQRGKKQLESNVPRQLIAMNYDGMPKGNGNATSLDRQADTIRRKQIIILEEKRRLKELEGRKNKILEKLSHLQGLEYKVAFKKKIENKPLQEIADELGYSIDRIKQISAKIKKA